MNHFFSTVCIFILALMLQSCDRYLITFNDQPIRQPATLLADIKVQDPALNVCIKQTIIDNNIESIKQLQTLLCTHAGVTTLTGIEQLTAIAYLDLSGNNFNDIRPLFFLGNLKKVDIAKNSTIPCSQLELFVNQTTAQVTRPEHCLN